MKVAIIGAGAIGCVTGALLHGHGHDVTLVGREDSVSGINGSGLVIDGVLGGERHEIPAKTALDFTPDIIMLAVKTQDVEAACTDVRPFSDGAALITMQNGVRSDEIAAGVLGKDRLISSVVMFGATTTAPGRVTYNFESGLIIGEAFPGSAANGALDAAQGLLSGIFELHVTDDIHGAHWTKLVLNLNNALSGALGMSLQETFSDERVCRLGLGLMREAVLAMRAAGIKMADLPGMPLEKLSSLLYAPDDIGPGIYGGIMRGLSREPLPGSILQSIRRGRRTEIEYLNGEIIGLGLISGFKTPLNSRVTHLVREVENTGRFLDIDRLIKEMSI